MTGEHYDPYVATAEPASAGSVSDGLEVAPVNDGKADIVALARKKVQELVANPNNRDLADEISRVGFNTEQAAGATYELLKTSVRSSLKDLKSGGGITGDIIRSMTELREVTAPMDELAVAPRWFERVLGWFPGSNLIADKLRKIGAYYESHQDQIDGLIRSARAGQRRLVVLNNENKRFADDLRVDMENLDEALTLAKEVREELDRQIAGTPDGAAKRRLEGIYTIVTKRVESIAQTRAMLEMDLAAVDKRIVDNEIWYQKIGNQLMAGPRLLQAAMFIHLNLVESQRIAANSEAWDKVIESLMVSNAQATHAAHKGALSAYSRGIVTLEALAKAQKEFTDMFAEEANARAALVAAANKNILFAEETVNVLRKERTGQEAIEDVPSFTVRSLEVG